MRHLPAPPRSNATASAPASRLLLLLLAPWLLAGCARNYTGREPIVPREGLEVRVADDRLALTAVGTPEMMGDLLQRVTDAVHEGAEIYLAPGRYTLSPIAFTDTLCGNCEEATEDVPATYGLKLSGRRVRLVGQHPDSVVIETRAGYGVLFDGCIDCELVGVTITGGARDPDARATDAAVVVRDSNVRMRECVLRDNIGDSATVVSTVVGIAGVAIRENAHVDIAGCRILRNSWDGIAMYRGARARIHGNVIDGVDKASGAHIGGGRGVGIGLTWDADAAIAGNLVTRYWKGIGIFVDAHAVVRENVVEDVLTWGIAFWSASDGTPLARIDRNAVFRTGACAVMIDAGSPANENAGADTLAAAGRGLLGTPEPQGARGALTDNAIARTALDERYDSGEPYCAQRALALHRVPADFLIEGNILFDNRHAGDGAPPVEQLTRAEFVAAVQPLIERLRAWQPTRGSAFVREFGAP